MNAQIENAPDSGSFITAGLFSMDMLPQLPVFRGLNHDARKACRQFVLDTLARNHLLPALRGSWSHGDFHLHPVDRFSLSDLDLVVPNLSATDHRKLKDKLQSDLAGILPMKVSIHPADSLLKMTLEDSFVLNIGEFIAKTHMRATNEPLYEHTLAKISLLLLRIHTTERYTDIAYRIGTREAFSALSVKLGATTGFPLQAARRLLKLGSTSFSSEFFERCVLQRANADFLYLLRNRIQLCSSIELWLQEYLIAKIDGATK